jgi:hypothetical protein
MIIFITCPISKVVWGVLVKALGTNYMSGSFWQAMAWFHAYLANHEKFHVVILVFVCWPI